MSTFFLLTITGLGLGALYFLIASGLSLIYGLMGVLNFAHGAFLTVGAYAAWWTESKLDSLPVLPRFLVGALAGLAVGAVVAALVELLLIRPLYQRHIEQVLVTVGLALALTALVQAIWGNDARPVPVPEWTQQTTHVLGAPIPNDRWVEIGVAIVVLVALELFLAKTRYGLIIRAGVENRAMVTALGIDVRRAFTLVFALGGARPRSPASSRRLLRHGRPGPRHVAADLRLHRRRDRRPRLDPRHGRRRSRRRARAAVRELLRLVRARRPLGRAAARARPARPARRAAPKVAH